MGERIALGQPNILFGRVQTVVHLWAPPTTPFTYKVLVEAVRLQNNAGGAIACGLGVHLPDSLGKLGSWVDATTTFTDDTTDAQDSDADDFTISTLTNNDGHVIGCKVPFNAVSYDITTAEGGSAGTYQLQYWNGTAWTTLVPLVMPTFASQAEHVLVFAPPVDWVKGGSGTGVDSDYYNIRVRATTAPGGPAAVAKRIHLARLELLGDDIANNGELRYEGATPLLLAAQGDGLCAYFQTASDKNIVEAVVQLRG
jgi:hypothetical protein